jgi:phage shock protein E
MSQSDRLVIDVREPEEYTFGHYEGAINIPLSTIQNSLVLTNINRDTPLVVYCRSGARSQKAQQYLQSSGFTNVINGINQENVSQLT